MKRALAIARAEQERTAEDLTRLIDTANAPIIGIDAEGRVNEWNQTAARITGFEKLEVLGRNLVSEFIADDYQVAVKEVLDKALLGEEPSNYEFPLFNKAGERREVLLNSTTRRDSSGAVIGVGQDITERKATERMKTEFVSVVSHELRTPLISISGSLALLDQGLAGPLPEEAQELALIASRNCGRLIRRVNDILDLEKFHAGMVKMRVETSNLFGIIEQASVAVSGLATAEEVSVTLPERTEDWLEVDEERIIQVLTNLMSNAIKFTPAGGAIQIEHTELEDVTHGIAVRDFGEGLKPSEHSIVFDKFRQLDSLDSRAKGGTELGLAICKSIVDQHGG
jgi:PAS domain S-box-containing protein